MIRQGTAEWLDWRRGGIGSSDAPVILGVSPWMTAYQLWEEKTGRREPRPANAAMERGTLLEPAARRAYEQHTGHIMEPYTLSHPARSWMRASLDGRSFDGDLLLEVKVPGPTTHAAIAAGKVPTHIQAQVQHQLYVAQAKVAHLWSFDGVDGVLVEVFPASAYTAKLLEAEEAFWQCVLTDTPPPLGERDVIERTDAPWLSAAEMYRQAESVVAEWTAKREASRECLISLMDGAARCQGNGVIATQYTVAGSTDYKAALTQVCPTLDLEPWRKPSRKQIRISIGKEQ